MNFTYNGNKPENVNWNSNALDYVKYNGDVVWERSKSALVESCWFATSNYSATPNGFNDITSPLNGRELNEMYNRFGTVVRLKLDKAKETGLITVGFYYNCNFAGTGGNSELTLRLALPGIIPSYETLIAGNCMGYVENTSMYSVSRGINISSSDSKDSDGYAYKELYLAPLAQFHSGQEYCDVVITETNIFNSWMINTNKSDERCVKLV